MVGVFPVVARAAPRASAQNKVSQIHVLIPRHHTLRWQLCFLGRGISTLALVQACGARGSPR
jgi:hypothetical protein